MIYSYIQYLDSNIKKQEQAALAKAKVGDDDSMEEAECFDARDRK